MSKDWSYSEDRKKIIIEPPKQRLTISGHRLAGVLNLDPYTTPFQMWCECTKLVKKPFEETKYIIAGRAAEPKIIDYVSKHLPNVVSIEEYYGNIFEEYRYNNFKDESKIFGGVIDAVCTLNDKRTITMIVECKTSSHAEQWADGNIPIPYLLQASLYSYLKGLKEVVFACTFLDDMDYAHPENIEVNDKNTIIRVVKLNDLHFDVNGTPMTIQDCIAYATEWWNTYVLTGVSPEFDETKDKEYLDLIRETKATNDSNLLDVCNKAFKLSQDIKKVKEESGITNMENNLKMLENAIKQEMISSNQEKCGNYTLKYKTDIKFDEDRFANEHEDMYKEYLFEKDSYTLMKDKGEK